jgi:hypothetical protein
MRSLMQLTITSPKASTNLSRSFGVKGTCDGIPAGNGPRIPAGGPVIEVWYLISGDLSLKLTAQNYSDQTWEIAFNNVAAAVSATGSLTAHCSDARCPDATVASLTVT